MPLMPELLDAHPRMRVEIQLTERIVDLVHEGLDLAICIADLSDTDLVARRIGTVRRVICAAPAYLARRGRPETRRDLAGHDCLTLVGSPRWRFDGATGVEPVHVSGRLTCDAIYGLLAACRAGAGLAMLSTWSAASDLAAGRLIEIELDAPPHSPPISAVYPSARMVAPRVRVFLDKLSQALADEARQVSGIKDRLGS